MSHHNTPFHQLALAREHHHGQKLRSASRWDQFLGMALSQVYDRQSLRDIESNLQAQHNKPWLVQVIDGQGCILRHPIAPE